jgi:hypothetical protein
VLAWLLTTIAIGLALLTSALIFTLDSYRSALQARQAEISRTYSLRETESQRLTAAAITAQTSLDRINGNYAELQGNLNRLAEARAKREALVNQSTGMQVKLESLIMDLLILSKSDTDALTLVVKYGIRQESPTTPPTVTRGR